MLMGEVLQKTTEHFKQKGFPSARLDAELVLAHALSWKRLDLYLKHEYPLNETELTQCREAVKRRSQGEPVAYICGSKGFFKHDFIVTRDVLIPRPETELLVENGLEFLKKQKALIQQGSRGLAQSNEEGQGLRIVDFGAGSGCIGLSIIAEVPEAISFEVDISEKALAVAHENAKKLQVSDRVLFKNFDLNFSLNSENDAFKGANENTYLPEGWEGTIDLVVANPPYISEDGPIESSVKQFEPSIALFGGGSDGTACIKSWLVRALKILRPGGCGLFEIGYDQAQEVMRFLAELGVDGSASRIIKDLAGHDRILCFYKHQK